MIVIGEGATRHLVPPREAIAAVEQAFRHIAGASARNFPVVRERLLPGPDVYGIKSGVDLDVGVLGLKIGGYWTGNLAHGLTNHQSTTVLTDPTSGRPTALVSSNYLTGVRTAAACALAIRELARPEVQVLGLIGAGAQALYHIEAACLMRNFDLLLIAGRTTGRAESTAERARAFIAETRVASAEAVAREAEVLITLTPAVEPVVQHGWVCPGTHICAMGADTAGKHELDTELVLNGAVYVDDWSQASSIGECQHAAKVGLTSDSIRGSLGDLLEGRIPGRSHAEEITIFDSTGLAVQDLAVAAVAVRATQGKQGEGVYLVDLAR